MFNASGVESGSHIPSFRMTKGHQLEEIVQDPNLAAMHARLGVTTRGTRGEVLEATVSGGLVATGLAAVSQGEAQRPVG